MDRDFDDEEEEDEEKEDEKEVVEEDEDEEEVKNDDDGKDPRTIGHREKVDTSADDANAMVDEEPTAQPEQGQVMRNQFSRPQLASPAPWQQCPARSPRPRTVEIYTLSGLEFVVLVTPLKPRAEATTLRAAEAAGNSSDIAVEEQQLSDSACGNILYDEPQLDVSLPDVPPLDVPLLDVPHADVPLSDVPLTDVPPPDISLSVVGLDGWVGEE